MRTSGIGGGDEDGPPDKLVHDLDILLEVLDLRETCNNENNE